MISKVRPRRSTKGGKVTLGVEISLSRLIKMLWTISLIWELNGCPTALQVEHPSHAKRKVEVTMDLKRQYSRGELTKLLYRTREILKESREFTSPGVVTNNVEDLRDQRFIKSLREYLDELKEYSHHFEQDEKENITKNCKEIEEYISQLTEETDDKKRYSIEDKIHSSLGEILQVIKPKTELF